MAILLLMLESTSRPLLDPPLFESLFLSFKGLCEVRNLKCYSLMVYFTKCSEGVSLSHFFVLGDKLQIFLKQLQPDLQGVTVVCLLLMHVLELEPQALLLKLLLQLKRGKG